MSTLQRGRDFCNLRCLEYELGTTPIAGAVLDRVVMELADDDVATAGFGLAVRRRLRIPSPFPKSKNSARTP